MTEEEKQDKKRTIQQNKALHLYYRFVADQLANAGYNKRKLLNAMPSVELPATPLDIKELWRVIQLEQLGKTSTKDLTTKEIDKIFDILNLALAESTGIHVPFPSIEDLFFMQDDQLGINR